MDNDVKDIWDSYKYAAAWIAFWSMVIVFCIPAQS